MERDPTIQLTAPLRSPRGSLKFSYVDKPATPTTLCAPMPTIDLRQELDAVDDAHPRDHDEIQTYPWSDEELWKIALRAVTQDPSSLTETQQDKPHIVDDKATHRNTHKPHRTPK